MTSSPSPALASRRRFGMAVAACLAAAAGACAAAEEPARAVPAFSGTESAGASTETAVLAGGCFWGVQGVFQHVDGVLNAVSGYAGGEKNAAQYETVSRGMTGHAEAVQISFDPRRVSYARLLQIFFSVAHDPTQLNRQGPDLGTQYRSAIFPANAEQARIAREYIAQLNQARVFRAAMVTKIEKDRPFYAAEEYHQDFLTRHPEHPYIMAHDLPKLADLKRLFAGAYRAEPALVAAAGR